MAGRKSKAVDETLPLQGSRLVRQMQRLLERLHSAGTERDTAGNRRLFMDQYVSLLLLYFFNPAIDSLRALQQVSGWEQTRRKLGITRTSLGSLNEAARVFDAALLEPILEELVAQALPLKTGREAEALRGLTAVDGSVFRGLSRMAWALWTSQNRAVKLHLHFDVLKGVPAQLAVTPAACSEPGQLESMLQAGRLYVLDRGYASFELFAAILRGRSSFVARVKDDITVNVLEERPISQVARDAGVIRDVILARLGTSHHKDVVGRPLRLVIVRVVERDRKEHELWLITDLLDLDADLVALAYRYRWTIELFFRWLKCVLGTRHLVAENSNGVLLQMYAACMVCLLIQLRTGRQPTKRTFEAIQFYLMGWVSDEELDAHLSKLPAVKVEKNPA
jgi:hypothetical protein